MTYFGIVTKCYASMLLNGHTFLCQFLRTLELDKYLNSETFSEINKLLKSMCTDSL